MNDTEIQNVEQLANSEKFLATISHEIRTPIQTIIGTLELLSDTELNQEQLEYTRQLKFSSDVLLSLINDFLDYSKIQEGQLRIEEISFDFHTLIRDTIKMLLLEANKKKLELLIDVDPRVPKIIRADPLRLKQIVLNLCKNAIKFTEQGHILIHVGLKDEYIVTEIIDTGIGISDATKANIFSAFFQGDISTTRRYGGTGLGLPITKTLINLMGGEIFVKDNEPHGTVFQFTIPLKTSIPDTAFPVFHLPTKKKILIIEAYEPAAKNIQTQLCCLGFSDVTYITNPEDTIPVMEKNAKKNKPFELVFMDLEMPKIDGWHIAAKITNNRLINSSSLYLMSNESSLSHEAKMKMLPWFNGYIYKPITKTALVKTLKKLDSLTSELSSPNDFLVTNQVTKTEEQAATEQGIEEKSTENIPQKSYSDENLFYGTKVLLAEDHPVNQKLLKMLLLKAGCSTVLTADNGKEAVELFKSHEDGFDIIFMDYQMPIMNGCEATIKIRQMDSSIPIIACTANSFHFERSACFSSGMNDILLKPFKKEDIVSILKKYRG